MSVLTFECGNLAASTLAHPHSSCKPTGSTAKNFLSSKLLSSSALGHDKSPGATSNVYLHESPHSNASLIQDVKSIMTSYGTAISSTSTTAKKSHAKLHKRGGSGSSTSLPGPPSALRGSSDTFTTPLYEEPYQHHHPDVSPTPPPASSTPRLKPYLRKMSKDSTKDDQGKLDLSRSTADNDRLSGLGIQDLDARIASDVKFSHSRRRTTSHSRTISASSHVSNTSTSASFTKPSQPFIHPMRQTPRPAPAPSTASSDETDERADEFHPSPSYPAPSDLGLSTVSASNFSTDSFLPPTSPSSRTSFDRAFSLVTRKSDLEPEARDARIRLARRKFDEKEALKTRKAERKEDRTRSHDRSRRSDSYSKKRKDSKATSQNQNQSCEDDEKETFGARPYEAYREVNEASLPVLGGFAGAAEKVPQMEFRAKPAKGAWVKFETWTRTRVLGCGK